MAPLPFGAGLKGKFIDAMTQGTPNVTTAVGAEGMLHQGRMGRTDGRNRTTDSRCGRAVVSG